jgi:ketosteroid isomerase-like protein
MSKIASMKSIVLAICTLCCTTAVTAQDPAAEIQKVIDKYARSINLADTTLAAEIWSSGPDVSMIHPRGHEHGWQQVKQNFYEKTMGATFSERTLKPREIKIHVLGDAAWAEFYWDFEAKFKSDGRPLTTKGRETQIYKKSADGWRIVHVHYSGMPVTGERQGF